jgi:hypothetical protein
MKWKRISSHQLRHPLLAVVVGGAISAVLAPYITEHLQNYQKELEVKTDLVSRISEATAAIATSAQLFGIKYTNYTVQQQDANDAYQKWEISSAAIGSQLRAYFPDTQLDQDWGNYSEIMADFFSLSLTNDACHRLEHVQKIQMYMFDNIVDIRQAYICGHNENFHNIQRSHYFVSSDNIDWITLVTRGNPLHMIKNWTETVKAPNSDTQYETAFYTLKQKMLNQKDVLVRRIIQSHIPF